MFEDLPALDDYELIRHQFAPLRIKVKAIEFKALFRMRDLFADYFGVERRKILVCLLDFFKDDFFLLMPIYETLRKVEDIGIRDIKFSITLYHQERPDLNLDDYHTFIHKFLCMICNLK